MTRTYWTGLTGFAAGVVLLTLGVIAFYYLKPEPEVVGTTTEAKQAPELKKAETLPMHIELIKVFKPEVKAKLKNKLPQSVVNDPGKRVVASSKVGGDDKPHTVTTLLDQSTGQFTTYDHIEPLPWLAVKTYTHIGAYYGLKNGEQAVRIQAQQEMLQIKTLHIEAVASIDIGAGKPDSFIGVGGRFSF